MSGGKRKISEGEADDKKPVLLALRKLKPTSKGISSRASGNDKRTFSCVLCCEQFSEHSTLKEHFRNHATKSKDPTEECFIRVPSNSSPFGIINCEFCHAKLPNISKAIEHKHRKHRHEGKNYSCEVCGRLFPLLVALEQHKQSSHKNNESNTKKTSSADNSLPIMKNNLSETESSGSPKSNKSKEGGDFVCKFCSSEFLSKPALEFHEKRVHVCEQEMLKQTFIPPPSTKIKVNHNSEVFSVYYCHLCGSEYILKFNLKKHLRNHHTEEERKHPSEDGLIRCTLCESIFYTKKAYEAHAVHHRPDDLYVTSEEHRKQVVNRVDQDFDFRRVPTMPGAYCQKSGNRRSQNSNIRSDSSRFPKESDDESMSPPSCESDSSDDYEVRENIQK